VDTQAWYTSVETYERPIKAPVVVAIEAKLRRAEAAGEPKAELDELTDELERVHAANPDCSVTLRLLDAGAKAEIEDTVALDVDADAETATPRPQVGRMKILVVEKAIVDWTIPGPSPTPSTIRALHPAVFEQIFAWASFGDVPPVEPESPAPPPPAGSDAGG
jgi:hypothetical protein